MKYETENDTRIADICLSINVPEFDWNARDEHLTWQATVDEIDPKEISVFLIAGGQQMTKIQLQLLREIWNKYEKDPSYSTMGKLGLEAWMGEQTGALLAEIDRLGVVLKGIQESAYEDIRNGLADGTSLFQIEADARAALGNS